MAVTPEDLDGLLAEAHAAASEDRDAVAAELFAAYLRHRPEDGAAWHRYGIMLRVLGLRNEAERALQRALELRPSNANVRVQLGMLHENYGDRERAERFFSEACELFGQESPGWLWIFRGANLAVMNRLAEAEAAHRQALLSDNVDLDEAWLNLGYVLRAQGQYDEALAAFEKGRELEPADKDILYAIQSLVGIGEALERIRNLKEVNG